jgi:hypothetical protein
VTPLGLAQHAVYRLLYNQANGAFGKSRALRCPHYLVEGGHCGIWKHRESVCATWFCKHECGAAGYRFWQATKQLLRAAEEELSAWCVFQLDVGTEVLRLLFPSVPQGNQGPLDRYLLDEGTVDPSYSTTLWGTWAG